MEGINPKDISIITTKKQKKKIFDLYFFGIPMKININEIKDNTAKVTFLRSLRHYECEKLRLT